MSNSGLIWKQWIKTVRAEPLAVIMIEADTGVRVNRQELTFLATKFHQENLQKLHEKKVVLCYANSLAWMVAFLAVQRGNGTVIALDAGSPTVRQEELAGDLGAEWLLSEERGEVYLGGKQKSNGRALIKLTSGSSGKPKQILCRAEHLMADGRAIIKGMGLRSQDRNLALIPLSHSYALGNVVMPLVLKGMVAVVAKTFVPSLIPTWIKQYKITVFPSVPVVFGLITKTKETVDLQPLRLAISAGAALPAECAIIFYKRFELNIHNFYGSSETGGICYDRDGDLTRTGQGLGKVLPGVKLTISKSGRVSVSSPAVATRSGKFTLKDTGSWAGNKTFQLLSRCCTTANIGGKKVKVEELQHVLQRLSAVREVWVGLSQHEQRDHILALVATCLEPSAVKKELLKQLPAWKIPHVLCCVSALPKTPRGKVDVLRAKELLLASFPA